MPVPNSAEIHAAPGRTRVAVVTSGSRGAGREAVSRPAADGVAVCRRFHRACRDAPRLRYPL